MSRHWAVFSVLLALGAVLVGQAFGPWPAVSFACAGALIGGISHDVALALRRRREQRRAQKSDRPRGQHDWRQKMPDVTLWHQLGEEMRIRPAAIHMFNRTYDDPETAPYFDGVSKAKQVRHFVEMISQLSDGPLTYSGPDLKEAHLDLGITESAFNKVVGFLVEGFRLQGTPDEAVQALLAKVAPAKPDIVTA